MVHFDGVRRELFARAVFVRGTNQNLLVAKCHDQRLGGIRARGHGLSFGARTWQNIAQCRVAFLQPRRHLFGAAQRQLFCVWFVVVFSRASVFHRLVDSPLGYANANKWETKTVSGGLACIPGSYAVVDASAPRLIHSRCNLYVCIDDDGYHCGTRGFQEQLDSHWRDLVFAFRFAHRSQHFQRRHWWQIGRVPDLVNLLFSAIFHRGGGYRGKEISAVILPLLPNAELIADADWLAIRKIYFQHFFAMHLAAFFIA